MMGIITINKRDEVEQLNKKKNSVWYVSSPTRVQEQHLSFLFDISQSTICIIFISWINFMDLRFGTINIWPTREVIDKTMSKFSKQNTPSQESSSTV